jgi:hypothetical protein
VSDLGDGQDLAEALDADKIADDRGFADEPLGDYPPDRPLGVDAYGVTPQQDKIDEPLDERVAHEEPDPLVKALDELADDRDAEDRDADDRDADDRALDDLDGSGRDPLAEALDVTDPDDDDDAAVRAALGVGSDGETAEEAAVHVEPEP